VVTVDFVVEVDGHVVSDAGAEGYQGELGAGTFLKEIDEALTGKSLGGTSEAVVGMAENHPHAGLRGKSATFRLTLKDVKERVLPDADDEFAKDLGEYDTLADLKKELQEQVEKRLKEEAENAVAQGLVLALVEKNPIDVPPSLVSQQMRVSEQELLQAARRQGQVGNLPPELRDRIRQDSEVKVRAGLLMAEIAKNEGIKIGDPEIEEGLKELADQTGKNVAKLRAEYREAKKREMLVGMILENKVLDIIESKAKIEEQT
jgi:trigger factor